MQRSLKRRVLWITTYPIIERYFIFHLPIDYLRSWWYCWLHFHYLSLFSLPLDSTIVFLWLMYFTFLFFYIKIATLSFLSVDVPFIFLDRPIHNYCSLVFKNLKEALQIIKKKGSPLNSILIHFGFKILKLDPQLLFDELTFSFVDYNMIKLYFIMLILI